MSSWGRQEWGTHLGKTGGSMSRSRYSSSWLQPCLRRRVRGHAKVSKTANFSHLPDRSSPDLENGDSIAAETTSGPSPPSTSYRQWLGPAARDSAQGRIRVCARWHWAGVESFPGGAPIIAKPAGCSRAEHGVRQVTLRRIGQVHNGEVPLRGDVCALCQQWPRTTPGFCLHLVQPSATI